MRLRVNENKDGTKNYYVLQSYRNDEGISTTKIYEKLGTSVELAAKYGDADAWAKEYVQKLNESEIAEGKRITVEYSATERIAMGNRVLYDGGYLFLQKIFYELRLDYICGKIEEKYKFTYSLRDILMRLIYGRILFPTSKSGTFEYSQGMLEKSAMELHQIYRALDVIAKENEYIQSAVYKNSKKMGKRKDTVLYYDCTNFFFEIEQEDGIRKYGRSKENRPNPIVEFGMFMDGDGIPLAFCLHPGNTNEQKTMVPLEEKILSDFDHARFIVCTDAGLSSIDNRKFNNKEERAFITAQSIKKMKDFQKKWALSPDGWRLPGSKEIYNLESILEDEALCEKYYHQVFFKEEWYNEHDIEQRYITTFSLKYREYQRNIRNEQIERAEAALKSEEKCERTRQTDYKRFIGRISCTKEGEVSEQTKYYLKKDLVEDEERYDGYYAVATNLESTPEEIIRINKKRWEIEESFRLMKTEFKSRPVYLSRDERILAHFTTCFLSLIVIRYLEKKLNHAYTMPEILEQLQRIQFFRHKDFGYSPAYMRTALTDSLHDAVGFHTDYEIISKKDFRKLISLSKSR